MPIFAGILAGLFGKLFQFFGFWASWNIAMGLAIAATAAVAIATVKASLAGIWIGANAVAPAILVTAMHLIMPANLENVVTAILVVDVIRSSFDYWVMTAGLVVGGRVK